MAYATQQDIIDRYGEDALHLLADRDNNSELDTPAIDRTLEDASEHINAFLMSRYELPLPVKPYPLLTRLCVDISLYWLGEDRGGASDERRKRFEDAERMLTMLAKGDIKLDTSTSGDDEKPESDDENAASNNRVSMQSADRLFTRESLRGF